MRSFETGQPALLFWNRTRLPIRLGRFAYGESELAADAENLRDSQSTNI